MNTAREAVDYGRQIDRLRRLLEGYASEERVTTVRDPEAAGRRLGVARRGEGVPSVVVGSDVGVELGRPGTSSRALLLTTAHGERVHDGVVRCYGPELKPSLRELPFALIVIVAMDPEDEVPPAELDAALKLSNRIPWVMSRTLPGRLWLRVGRAKLREGFGLEGLGTAAWVAFRRDHLALKGVEIVVATHGPLIQGLTTIAAEVRVLAGEHRKLRLAGDGLADCVDLDCDDCEEQTSCDELRDISVRYRRRFDGTG